MTAIETIGAIVAAFGATGLLPAKNAQEERNTMTFLVICLLGCITLFVGYMLSE